MGKLELGVLVSGGGSNLQAILDAVAAGTLDARVRVVISNVAGVKALERAQAAGVEALTLPHGEYASREAFEVALVQSLQNRGVEWVALAGFMRVLRGPLLKAYEGRLVNIHPALLPSFPGTHGQRQAVQYGAKVSGCTVHFVDEGVDTGPIIAQRAVPVLDDDDEGTLGARILEQEHALFVEVLRWIAADRVRIERRDGARPRVRVLQA
jgi:phosphoribosylglycinamide formyltransferase-1